MSQSFYRVILSHAPKFLTGSVFASIATLIMTKYYTAVFSTAEYGVLTIYLLMYKYVASLTSLNLDSTSSRFYFDYRQSRRDEYLSTIFWFISAIAVCVILVGLVVMGPVSELISKGSQNLYLFTLIMAVSSVYVNFLTRVLYNEHRSSSVLKHSIFQTTVNHCSSVVFIMIFNLGVLGRICGQGLGYILNVVSLIKEFSFEGLFKIKFVFNKSMARETFILAIPSMVSILLGMVFLYADRFFLKYYLGDSSVGIYSLGYMLGQSLSLVYEAISQAMLPKVYNDLNRDYQKSLYELESFSYRYNLFLILITAFVSALSPLIVTIVSNENYDQASYVMPFVMAGFMMGGIYKIPSLVLGFHKIVWFYPFLSVFSFGTNVLLNWVLIPRYGIVGSAYASFIGIFLYSLILQLMGRKYMSRTYNLYTYAMYLLLILSVSGIFVWQL